MHSCWPVALAAGAAAHAFVLARFIGSWCCCRCLQVGPFNTQLQQLPVDSHWPITYAVSATADAFALAHCICIVAAADLFKLACNIESCCCCRCLLRWPIANANAAVVDAFVLAH